jgi:hypothetical protein
MNNIDNETNELIEENKNQDPIKKIIKRVDLDYQHARMIEYFVKNKIYSYKIVEADPSYYKLNLNQRKNVLGAYTIDILCKTIVLENTAFDPSYESDYYRKYYMAIVQYVQEIHGEKIAKALKAIQNANSTEKLSNKYFHFRLAKDDDAFNMTGYRFNCITPFLSKKDE